MKLLAALTLGIALLPASGALAQPSGPPRHRTPPSSSSWSRDWFSADANDYILQVRAWQRHDVGDTPGFGGDVEKALRSIKARVLYMPAETDLYFPMTDARYEQALIQRTTFTSILSLWGHTAGTASNPADLRFLNKHIGRFLNVR
jgi:homoserine O-acetyltransferase